MEGRLLHNPRGFTFLEVLISIGLLGFVAVTIAAYSNLGRIQSASSHSTDGCGNEAQSLLNSITALDNAMVVRSWLPSVAANSKRPNQSALDPFCNSQIAGHQPLCDQFDTLTSTQAGLVDLNQIRGYQNIRGAATWAQAALNENRPHICKGNGINFKPANTIRNFLPVGAIDLPGVQSADLLIQEDPGGSCPAAGGMSTLAVNSPIGYMIRVNLNYKTVDGLTRSCSARAKVRFPTDHVRPSVSVKVTDLNGNEVAEGKCTCKNPLQANAVPACKDNGLQLILQASEPGSTLLCNKTSPAAENMGAGNFVACRDFILGGVNAGFAQDTTIPVYFKGPYSPPPVVFKGMKENVQAYTVTVMAVDVGGNRSAPVTKSFLVKQPSCPSTLSYCPNANHTCAPNEVSIMCRPADSCQNGLCPLGTRKGIGCPDPATVCTNGNPGVDDCGNACSPGTKVCFAGSCEGCGGMKVGNWCVAQFFGENAQNPFTACINAAGYTNNCDGQLCNCNNPNTPCGPGITCWNWRKCSK